MTTKIYIPAIIVVILTVITILVSCKAASSSDEEGVDASSTQTSNKTSSVQKFISSQETSSEAPVSSAIETSSIVKAVSSAAPVVAPRVSSVAEPVAESIPDVSGMAYTEDDLFCLAVAVCREAGGSTEEIQLLVANVVINRVNDPNRYANTIRGVLTQKNQYAGMWKYGVSFPKWAKQANKDHCYSIAKRILDGERYCPANVVYQAEFRQGSGIYKKITSKGTTFYFCY